jgi:hypothetical protein
MYFRHYTAFEHPFCRGTCPYIKQKLQKIETLVQSVSIGRVARSLVVWVIQICRSPVSCVQCEWVGSRERERCLLCMATSKLIFHSVVGMWMISNYVELVELYWRGNCNSGKNSSPIFGWLITIKQNLFNTNFVSALNQSLVMTIKLRAVWVQIPIQLEFCSAACTLTGRTARTSLFLDFRSILLVLWERQFRQWHG